MPDSRVGVSFFQVVGAYSANTIQLFGPTLEIPVTAKGRITCDVVRATVYHTFPPATCFIGSSRPTAAIFGDRADVISRKW